MAERKSPWAKAGLAAGVLLAGVGAGALALHYLAPPKPAPVEQPRIVVPAEPPPTLLDKLPLPPPLLDRAALIAAGEQAADAFAAGKSAPEANAALAGRSFSLRLPFGCGASDPVAMATYNADRKTVKLAAQPHLWGKQPWVRALAGDMAFEAVEGFWISRPWTRSETCPTPPAEPAEPAPPAKPAKPAPPAGAGQLEGPAEPAQPVRETLGVAQFFAPGASRTRQRGTRPYEVTRKLPADAPATRSYQLVLSGRLVAFGDGQPVRCWSESSQLRPRCLFAVELTRVAFENPTTGETLAEWRD